MVYAIPGEASHRIILVWPRPGIQTRQNLVLDLMESLNFGQNIFSIKLKDILTRL